MVYIDVYIEYNALSLNQTFTYRCLENVQIGCRVKVPFGKQIVVGYVQAIHSESKLDSIKDVIEVIDSKPLLNPELDDLADWMSSYYVASKISCLKTMLPPAMRPSHTHSKIIYEDWVELNSDVSNMTKKQREFIASNTFPCKASVLRKNR